MSINSNSGNAARDMHLRHTATDGTSYVQCHRVWNADLFLASRQADARQLNDKVNGDSPRKAKVELITRETYLTEKAPK